MSSPVHHPEGLDPALMYAPPWAREARQAPVSPDAPPLQPLPRSWRSTDADDACSGDPAFSGDVAVTRLQRQLARDPDMVPQPPRPVADHHTLMQMALRLCAAAVIAAAVAWAMIALPGMSLLSNDAEPAAVTVSPIAITPSPQDETRAATAALLIRHGLAKAAAAKEPPQPVASLPPAPAPAAVPTVAAPPVPVPQPAPPLPDTANSGSDSLLLDRDEIDMLVRRGQELLANGDISSARLLLRRAAAAGNADAALALGETFDPQVIQRLGAVGAEPDAALARQWYQRASDLGSDAAAQQLAKLAQAPQ